MLLVPSGGSYSVGQVPTLQCSAVVSLLYSDQNEIMKKKHTSPLLNIIILISDPEIESTATGVLETNFDVPDPLNYLPPGNSNPSSHDIFYCPQKIKNSF